VRGERREERGERREERGDKQEIHALVEQCGRVRVGEGFGVRTVVGITVVS
jgi:hypothetical protein